MGGPRRRTGATGRRVHPRAAAAFRRAEAQVRDEFDRDIDANSTYRSRAKQLGMYNAWQAYISGRGPYPATRKRCTLTTRSPSTSPGSRSIPTTGACRASSRSSPSTASSGTGSTCPARITTSSTSVLGIPTTEKRWTTCPRKQRSRFRRSTTRSSVAELDAGRQALDRCILANIAESVGPIRRSTGPVSIRQEIADTKTKVYALEAAVSALATFPWR